MERQLEKAVVELAELQPSFVSVTYGALGSSRERTRDAVTRINTRAGVPGHAAPHLRRATPAPTSPSSSTSTPPTASRTSSPSAATRRPTAPTPAASTSTPPSWSAQVREHPGDFSVGVAAHPEIHPRSPDRDSDRRFLAAKLAEADFAITQFFFTVDDYLRMVDELAELGCDKPVIPGVMPIASVAGVRRMAGMNGSAIPDALLERLLAVDGQAEEVRKIGVETATELCAALLAEDAPGLHLYALNRSESVREIYANLGLG